MSVVIPARNAEATIAAAILSAFGQVYTGQLEVIVADGSSTDHTAEVAARLGARVISNPDRSTPVGLNLAVAAATGEVIVRCDAHSELPPGYVSEAVATLGRTGADNVGGMQEPAGEGFFSRAVAIAQSTPLGVGDARYRLGGPEGPTDTVYLGVFRREALTRVGGFDPTLERNQDYELNWRIRESGGVVWFDPRLRVRYAPRDRVGSLARQYFEYGIWKREVIRRHPRSLRWRQLPAPVLVIGLAASAMLALTGFRRISLVVPAVYLLALMGAALGEGWKRRDPAAASLPVALATMHICWGTGFLLGQQRRRTKSR